MTLITIDIKDTLGIQSIPIPDVLKIDDDKVYLKKIGNTIQIIPFHNPWQNMLDSLQEFTTDFMSERNQQNLQNRESFE